MISFTLIFNESNIHKIRYVDIIFYDFIKHRLIYSLQGHVYNELFNVIVKESLAAYGIVFNVQQNKYSLIV